jgi:hypothetical protein
MSMITSTTKAAPASGAGNPRIAKPAGVAAADPNTAVTETSGNATRNVEPSDSNEQRLLKVIPAEVVAAYLGVRATIDQTSNRDDIYLLGFAIIILILMVPYFKYALKVRDNLQVIFAMFTYVVWAANIDITRIVDQKPWIDGLALTNPILGGILQFVANPVFIEGLMIIWVIILIPMVTQVGRTLPDVASSGIKTGP